MTVEIWLGIAGVSLPVLGALAAGVKAFARRRRERRVQQRRRAENFHWWFERRGSSPVVCFQNNTGAPVRDVILRATIEVNGKSRFFEEAVGVVPPGSEPFAFEPRNAILIALRLLPPDRQAVETLDSDLYMEVSFRAFGNDPWFIADDGARFPEADESGVLFRLQSALLILRESRRRRPWR